MDTRHLSDSYTSLNCGSHDVNLTGPHLKRCIETLGRFGVRSKKSSPAAALIGATDLEAGQDWPVGMKRLSAAIQPPTALHYHYSKGKSV